MLAQGLGVKQDKYEAAAWFEKAISLGLEVAKHDLALLNLPKDGLKPEQRVALLRKAYSSYVTVKACYEARQGYLVQMITRNDFEKAKVLMRRVENASVLPREQKDELWKRASDEGSNISDAFRLAKAFGSSDQSQDMQLVCQDALIQLQETKGAKDKAPAKRDF